MLWGRRVAGARARSRENARAARNHSRATGARARALCRRRGPALPGAPRERVLSPPRGTIPGPSVAVGADQPHSARTEPLVITHAPWRRLSTAAGARAGAFDTLTVRLLCDQRIGARAVPGTCAVPCTCGRAGTTGAARNPRQFSKPAVDALRRWGLDEEPNDRSDECPETTPRRPVKDTARDGVRYRQVAQQRVILSNA